jgi:Leucine-rich repeat (LRR) protein
VLCLEANRISSVAEAAQFLPNSLEILTLGANQLARLQEFSFLSALDNLTEIDVEHNPFVKTARQFKFNYKPFLLFLLQHLNKLNSVPVLQSDQFVFQSRSSTWVEKYFHFFMF